MNDEKIWVVGTGAMAREYAKVLKALSADFTAIGRSQTNAERFSEETDCHTLSGGIEKVLSGNTDIPDRAIVAVSVDQLAPVTSALIQAGVQKILVEKPGCCLPSELESLQSLAEKAECRVYIAYNRRFYASVLEAEKIIENDGGLKSMHFEFTEWSRSVTAIERPREVFENWFYANSTHVVDLAFFIGGLPEKIASFTSGRLDWHTPAIFTGAGKTEKDVLFSYCANWNAPGRWGVELLTPLHRLYLKPMEQLQIQNLNSVKIDPVEIDDTLDRNFKPGLYRQTKAFLSDNISRLCPLGEQLCHVKTIYDKIVNG